jgi:hypothetical protein
VLNNITVNDIPEEVREELANQFISPDDCVDTKEELENFLNPVFAKKYNNKIETSTFAGYPAIQCGKCAPDWIIDIGEWRIFTGDNTPKEEQ